jgi:hypothetical protein
MPCPYRCEGRDKRQDNYELRISSMSASHETSHKTHACCGSGYASPQAAMQAEREKILYFY